MNVVTGVKDTADSAANISLTTPENGKLAKIQS
jgi:hypothetical protein